MERYQQKSHFQLFETNIPWILTPEIFFKMFFFTLEELGYLPMFFKVLKSLASYFKSYGNLGIDSNYIFLNSYNDVLPS